MLVDIVRQLRDQRLCLHRFNL